MIRRMRGILGIGLVWSVIWAVAGFFFGAASYYRIAQSNPELGTLSFIVRLALEGAVSWSTYGFALGSIFGGVLSIAERRRTLDTLRLWRVAAWGGMAGLLLPLGFILGLRILEGWTVDNAVSATAFSVVMGAGCAALSLRVARSGPADAKSTASIRGGEASSQRLQGESGTQASTIR